MAEWTKEREQAIKARCEAATLGPWEWIGTYMWGASGQVMDDGSAGMEYSPSIDPEGPDGQLIAHARTDLPDALAEIARLTEAVRVQAEWIRKRCPGHGSCGIWSPTCKDCPIVTHPAIRENSQTEADK